MGYAAARGGLDAIEAAEQLVRLKRMASPSAWVDRDQIVGRLRCQEYPCG